MSFRDNTAGWQDWDGAEYELGTALGLFDPERRPFQTKAKHVFWTNNPVGSALYGCLERLVEVGVLEGRVSDDPDDDPESANLQFRWNQGFVGSWEGGKVCRFGGPIGHQ